MDELLSISRERSSCHLKIRTPGRKKPAKYPLLLTVLSGLSFVCLLLLFVGNSFETLEDQLRFQAPTAGQANGNGSYGISPGRELIKRTE